MQLDGCSLLSQLRPKSKQKGVSLLERGPIELSGRSVQWALASALVARRPRKKASPGTFKPVL